MLTGIQRGQFRGAGVGCRGRPGSLGSAATLVRSEAASKMIVAYPTIWVIYIVMHIMLSALFRYDSLIPAWKLHS